MALTFRDNNGAPLSYDEMDSNWRFFTGSFTNTGTITAEGFTSNGNISASGYIGSDGPYYIQGIQFANYHLPSETIRLGWTGDNTLLYGTTITLNADVTASGNISSSADVYGVTGSFLHLEGDGSQLTGIGGDPFPFTGDAQISGSLLIANQADPEDIYFRAYGSDGDYSIYIDEQRQVSGRAQLYVGANDKGFTNGNPVVSGYNNVSSSTSLYTDRGIYANGNIYGSNISASGVLYGNSLNLEGANISYDSSNDILYFADSVKLGLGSGPAPAIPDISISHDGANGLIRNATGDLTIESSTSNTSIRNFAIGGNIILQSDKSPGGQGGVVLISGSNDDVRLDIRGNVTASGNISASGDMYSSMFRGEQLFLNSGSSQYLNTPAAGDAALIAMSGSGAFSTTTSIAPNNLVLFSEYKTGDTGTINGKAASSILLTVNHGAFNSNNAVAQIACVARTLGTNDTDLVFSTRQNSGTVNERMRIRNDKTQITGSLDVSGALSKGSGTFKIAHPISTGSLYHSFIEGPKCDLIYRGTTTLTNGVADINIDSVSNMTDGTFVALTQDPQLFLQNTTGWEPLRGSISGNILSIECKSTSSVDNVSWMVVAERADDFIKNWNLTDENGHLIPEQ